METRPDLLFGHLAVEAGYLTLPQLDDLLREQADSSIPLPLGQLCVERNLMSPGQVQATLNVQRPIDLPAEETRFGALALKNGLASLSEINLALEAQRQAKSAGAKLGEVLLQMETLTPQRVDALLKLQDRVRGGGAARAPAKEAASAGKKAGRPLTGLRALTSTIGGWFSRRKDEPQPPEASPMRDVVGRRSELLRQIGESALRAKIRCPEASAGAAALEELEAAEEDYRHFNRAVAEAETPEARVDASLQMSLAGSNLRGAASRFRKALTELGNYVTRNGIRLDGAEPKIAEVRALESQLDEHA